MKKIILLAAILFASFTVILGQNADKVKGTWLNTDKGVKIEIYESGNEYFDKMIWIDNMYESDGKTIKKDTQNPNEKLRNRSIANMVILSGFVYDDGEWTGGEIYNPENGKTYKSKMRLNGNLLEVRGYVGSPMFGKTTVWKRVS